MPKNYFKLIPAAHLIFIKDNQVLLARRFNTGYQDGYFALPAGHVEENERATQSMVREASEEIGLNLNESDLRVVHIMHRKSNDQRVDFFFEAKFNPTVPQEPQNCEPEKCDQIAWFPLNNLPENTSSHVRAALENYQNKIPYSEFGWE